jgi:hypothetical protein
VLPAVLLMCWFATASPAQTLLYSGGEWDFESGFYFVTHMLAGQCSNPPPGGHQSCVPADYNETVGHGWLHYASFPPPDWTGSVPIDWTTPGHWGVAQLNENQFQPNVSRGIRSQEITMTCANGVGMIYRQVSVPPGHRIRFEADSKYTPSSDEWPNIEAWMGLDPTGNTNPETASVQWFRWDGTTPLTWHRTREEIDASGPIITLFIMMANREPPCEGSTFMIDNVEVFDLGALGPAIERDPAQLNVSAVIGSDAADKSFTVRNSGTDTLNYTIADDAEWLDVSPASGSNTGQPDPITVSFQTAAMATGSYSAAITISAAGAVNSPQTVAVALEVRNKPGDFDGDGDVDQDDFGYFQRCFTGSGNGQTEPACQAARLDEDIDVDGDDFTIFQGCLSGAGVPSDAECH